MVVFGRNNWSMKQAKKRAQPEAVEPVKFGGRLALLKSGYGFANVDSLPGGRPTG
jgi:hypothetical protein